MQLVAYGAQDIYLTGNPMITYFKVVYRRHTNFAMESIQQTFNGTVGFGNRVSALISRNGDLVSGMVLEATLPAVNGGNDHRWVQDVGHHLISDVTVEIGGQQIDQHYSDWLEVWAQLTVPAGQKVGYREMIGQSPLAADGTLTGLQTNAGAIVANKIYVPLQFWFCRNVGLALPLIALQYHEVKVNISFSEANRLVCNGVAAVAATAQTGLLNAQLWVDYIYLDTDERRRFAQVSHEYLIEQLQTTGTIAVNGTTLSAPLNFNHPVKELVWIFKPTYSVNMELSNHGLVAADKQMVLRDNFAGRTAAAAAAAAVVAAAVAAGVAAAVAGGAAGGAGGAAAVAAGVAAGVAAAAAGGIVTASVPALVDAVLNLNGQQRFARRLGSYFNLVQTRCHTNIPDSRGIYVYSFALKPEDHQPSGSCNFSRIDNASLNFNLSGTTGSCTVYAVNYNVLRIMSGMGGMAYSN